MKEREQERSCVVVGTTGLERGLCSGWPEKALTQAGVMKGGTRTMAELGDLFVHSCPLRKTKHYQSWFRWQIVRTLGGCTFQ